MINFNDSHNKLLSYVKKLGYDFDAPGICFGQANMGMQALLVDEIDVFDKRLKQLMDIKPDEIAFKIANVKQKASNLSTLSKQEKDLFDILAFIEGTVLYFQPFKYQDLFEDHAKGNIQNTENTAPLVLNRKIEAKGGLVKPFHFSGIYNEDELKLYFKSLEKAIQNQLPTIQAPFALVISSSNHTITIGCNGKDWMYIDANHMPTQYIPINNTDEIAKKVHAGLLANVGQSSGFSTEVFVTKDNEQKLRPLFTEWKNQGSFKAIHMVNTENASRIDATNATWLWIASRNGQTELVKELLQCFNINPHQTPLNNRTPLYIAAENGHVAVVREILKYKGIYPSKGDVVELSSPLYIAAQMGRLDVVNELLAFYATDPNEKNRHDVTPLYIAAENGHIDIVKKFLAIKNINLNQTTKDGTTALFTAARSHHLAIVKLLLQAGADSKITLDLATKQNNTKIKDNIEKVIQEIAKESKKTEAEDILPLAIKQKFNSNIGKQFITALSKHPQVMRHFIQANEKTHDQFAKTASIQLIKEINNLNNDQLIRLINSVQKKLQSPPIVQKVSLLPAVTTKFRSNLAIQFIAEVSKNDDAVKLLNQSEDRLLEQFANNLTLRILAAFKKMNHVQQIELINTVNKKLLANNITILPEIICKFNSEVGRHFIAELCKNEEALKQLNKSETSVLDQLASNVSSPILEKYKSFSKASQVKFIRSLQQKMQNKTTATVQSVYL